MAASAGTGAQQKPQGWCLRNRGFVAAIVNGWLAIVALGALGMSGNAMSTPFRQAFLGQGGRWFIALMVVVLVASAIGLYGSCGTETGGKRIAQLVYFALLSGGFIGLFAMLIWLVAGGNMRVRFKNHLSELWCEYEDSAVEGQTEYACCGFACPADRPAGGSCPDLYVPPQGFNQSCDASQRWNGTSWVPAAAPVPFHQPAAVCAGNSGTLPGCEPELDRYLSSHLAPFTIVFIVSVAMLCIGECLTGFLLCRSTGKLGPPGDQMPTFVPGRAGAAALEAEMARQEGGVETDRVHVGAGAALGENAVAPPNVDAWLEEVEQGDAARTSPDHATGSPAGGSSHDHERDSPPVGERNVRLAASAAAAAGDE